MVLLNFAKVKVFTLATVTVLYACADAEIEIRCEGSSVTKIAYDGSESTTVCVAPDGVPHKPSREPDSEPIERPISGVPPGHRVHADRPRGANN